MSGDGSAHQVHESISRVPDQNGVSQTCFIVEKHHSGLEPSINQYFSSEFVAGDENTFYFFIKQTLVGKIREEEEGGGGGGGGQRGYTVYTTTCLNLAKIE